MTTPTPQEVRIASAHMKIYKAWLEGNRFNGLLREVSQPAERLRDMEVLIAYCDMKLLEDGKQSPNETTTMNEIDISKLNKAEVLAALYNNSRQQGIGCLNPDGQYQMTVEEAGNELKRGTYFDYLRGRVMKVDLSGDTLRTALYDRDNGHGAAAAALEDIIENARLNPSEESTP
jgi:hypothetical protein